jgi:hypothetical protein
MSPELENEVNDGHDEEEEKGQPKQTKQKFGQSVSSSVSHNLLLLILLGIAALLLVLRKSSVGCLTLESLFLAEGSLVGPGSLDTREPPGIDLLAGRSSH